MRSVVKSLLCSCLISSAVLASSAHNPSDDLFFSSQKISAAYQTYQQEAIVCGQEFLKAKDQLLSWTKSLALSSKPYYHQAEEFYIKKIREEAADLVRTLDQQKWEFVFNHLDQMATLENSLRIMVEDEKLDESDLAEEELREVTRVISPDEKVHTNRTIPPESDRCYEAIMIKRTRLDNSDTMVDMGASDLDAPALVSFTALPKFKQEESQSSDHKSHSYSVVKVDAYKNIYQVAANSFYRGTDFRLKYNKSDGFLFLTDLTILGESSALKSVSQGTKTKVDPKLLKKIEEDDSTRLPGKIDLIFDFSLGTEKALAFQMRLKEKKTKFFIAEGKDTNEWVINFVRSKDRNVVNHLMNEVLARANSAPPSPKMSSKPKIGED